MFGRSWWEKPIVAPFAFAFWISSLRMLTFGAADTTTNVCGESPPYGSGYEGFRMLTWLCSSVVSSDRSWFCMTYW